MIKKKKKKHLPVLYKKKMQVNFAGVGPLNSQSAESIDAVCKVKVCSMGQRQAPALTLATARKTCARTRTKRLRARRTAIGHTWSKVPAVKPALEKSRKILGIPLPCGREPGRFYRGQEQRAGGGLQVSRAAEGSPNSVDISQAVQTMLPARASSIDCEEPQVSCRRCVTASKGSAPTNRHHRAAKLNTNSTWRGREGLCEL